MATRKHALYRLLDHPSADAAKGACYLTGSAGPCVDTGVGIDFEGTLTISVGALKEMCEVAGFSFNAEGAQLEEDNALLVRQNEVQAQLISEQREELDAVGRLLAGAHARTAQPEKA